MNIKDIVNQGYRAEFPLYFNKINMINYKDEKNQGIVAKRTGLKKYNTDSFVATHPHKPITKLTLNKSQNAV